MAFDTEGAIKAGYSPEEIQAHLQGDQSDGKSFTQGASDFLRNIGLGAFPDAGAAIAGLFQGGITKQNPFITQGEFGNVQKEGLMNTLKDALGLASYAVPEIEVLKGGNILTRILAGGVNRGIQGGIMGGLSAASQGQNVVGGAEIGAIANPVLSGVGKALTDILPRYIGLRNFGPAGGNLPEVVKAENVAGGQSLKEARDAIVKNLPSFELNPSSPNTNPFILMDKIKNLANQPEWVGTPGLSELTKTSKKAFPTFSGKLADINKAINNASDPFDAYSRIKNMAYATDNTPAGNRLSAFLKTAAHTAREHLIETSSNPDATRVAMDNYALQTAMNYGKSGIGGNKITNLVNKIAIGGGAESGIAALTSMIPYLHGATLPLAIDTALTNSVTGPSLAKGLVNVGEKLSQTGISNLLRRLGISGAQGISQTINSAQ